MASTQNAAVVPAKVTRSTHKTWITILLLCNDALFIALAFYGAYVLRFEALFYPNPIDLERKILLSLVSIPVWILIMYFYRLYSTEVLFGGLGEYIQIFNVVTLGSISLVLIDFLFRSDDPISRGWLILTFVFALVLLMLSRYAFRHIIYFLRRRGHFLTPAVIVGAGSEGHILYTQLQEYSHSGLNILGFIEDRMPVGEHPKNGAPILGSLDDLSEVLQSEGVSEVIVASEGLTRQQILQVYQEVDWNPDVRVRLSSGLFELLSTGMRVKELASVPLIEMEKARITGIRATIKFAEDLILSLLLMIFLSPVFVILMILIRLDSPGPFFYRHRVYGLNKKPFDALKFRTMYNNAHEILHADPDLCAEFNENFKLKDDPRVTRLGRVLRKYSLDELPQLINVLRGQMSLVGPRFICPDELEKYGKWHMNLFTVKPGMTGVWQTSGRSDVSYEERVRLDMYYIRNWTLGLDIYLLLKTIPAVITKKGAY